MSELNSNSTTKNVVIDSNVCPTNMYQMVNIHIVLQIFYYISKNKIEQSLQWNHRILSWV